MKLNAQDMGAPDYQQALQNVFKNVQGAYDTAYKPKNMAEALLAAQLKNKHDSIINQYLPRSEEARIANTEAGTGLIGHQSKYYDRNAESEIALRDAQRGLYGAQAQQAAQEAEMKRRMSEMMFSQPGSSSFSGGQSNNNANTPGAGMPMYASNLQNSISQQGGSPFNQIKNMQETNQNSPYGIQSLSPSTQDLASKMLFGIDTYGDKQKQNLEQVKQERDAYTKKSAGIDSELAASNKQGQLLDRYNKLMDETLLTGPYGSQIKLPTAKRQEIQALSRDMILSGIEELKSAMGSAKFSNLDLQTATARKPDETWSADARREYTERFKAFNDRLNERAAFNQLASDPRTGVSSSLADRLWSAYQKHHPIVADAKTLELNKYKPDNWASYLTPEAISSIKERGDYNPKDKGLEKKDKTKEIDGKQYKLIKGEWYEL